MPKKKNLLERGLSNLRKKTTPKVEEPTEQSEQNQQNRNINARRRLLDAMEQVHFICPVKDRYTDKELMNKKCAFARLKQTLDNAGTLESAELAEMDEIMITLCGDLDKAFEYGDRASEVYIMKALTFGINEGHERLLGSQMEERDAILNDRLKKLKLYQEICKYAKGVDEETKSLDELVRNLEKEKEVYLKKLNIAIQAYKDENNQEDIRTMKRLGGNKSKMNPQQLELALIFDEPVKADANIEDMVIEKFTIEKKVEEYQNFIRLLDRRLADSWNNLMSQLNERVREITKLEAHRIASELDNIISAEEAWKQMHIAYKDAYQTDRVMEYLTASVDNFEDLYNRHLSAKDAHGKMKVYEYEEEEEEIPNGPVNIGV